MVRKIKVNSLRLDMFQDSLLSLQKFSIQIHHKRLEIAERVQKKLSFLEKNPDYVPAKDVKVWARYIDRFVICNQDRYLSILQNKVDYNLTQYLAERKKGLFARCFSFLHPSYMDSKRLTKKYQKYIDICRKMRKTQKFNKLVPKAEKLRDEAYNYAEDIINGRINIKAKDYKTLYTYLNVICYPPVEGDSADLAKKKIEALQQQQNIAEQGAVSQAVIADNDNGKQKKAEKTHHFGKLKVWALSGVVALAGGSLALKTCNMQKKNDTQPKHKTEILTNINANSTTKENAPIMEFPKVRTQQTATKTASAQVLVQSAANKNPAQEDSVQKIWRNYYDNTVEILSSAKTKAKLYRQIEQQLNAGIFTLPKDVSKERVAYAYLIYKAYGVNSSIGAALERGKKLSLSEQTRFAEDIKAAGAKGEGVKKMAQAHTVGKLGTYSRYDRAARNLQQKHAQNLHNVYKLTRQHQAR